MLDVFSVDNYKSFARNQTIEVRPLTLFFGWNSGGKSALIRFLPLISESIQSGNVPIWLAGDAGRQATWADLVCKSTERGNLRFSLSWSICRQLSAAWDISGDLEGRWQEANVLQLTTDKASETFLRHEMDANQWQGLVPSTSSDNIAELLPALAELTNQVQWISGIRNAPSRVISYSGGARKRLRPDGSDAALHLISEQLSGTSSELLKRTGELFTNLGDTLALENPTAGVWRVMLQPSKSAKVRVNICDTGEGYAQVLPVLVALARAQMGGPKLLCLEQPELHLHTRAQLELARILVETAKCTTKPKLLVETHSEVLLTRVQLAIAKGEISASDVRVYWVEANQEGTSEAIPIDFNDRGQPIGTALSSAFSETIQLGQALANLQIKKP